MTAPQQPDRPPWPRLILRRADQGVAGVILAISLIAIGGWWTWQARVRGGLIDIDRAEPVAVEFKIDVNQADCPASATGKLA